MNGSYSHYRLQLQTEESVTFGTHMVVTHAKDGDSWWHNKKGF